MRAGLNLGAFATRQAINQYAIISIIKLTLFGVGGLGNELETIGFTVVAFGAAAFRVDRRDR